jgi:3-hydroxyacyl-[acyl-carrier-protein] dehydratase
MMSALLDAIKGSAIGPSQRAQDAITGNYRFSDDFLGFSGHFPGYPILPAVVQLAAALSLIEEQQGQVELVSIQNAKFLQEIRPGIPISITCTDCQVKGMPGSRIRIGSGETAMSSFIMVFQDKGGPRC